MSYLYKQAIAFLEQNHPDLADALINYYNSNVLHKLTARDVLIEIADEFQNNYLTIACFADHNGLTESQAESIITLAQTVRASNHPDY